MTGPPRPPSQTREAAEVTGMVIGFGNPVRGDDGVGPAAAAAVQEAIPNLPVLTPHQLLPEHAEAVAAAAVVVFVDAADDDAPPGTVATRPVLPSERPPLDHALTPEGLVGLARRVFGRAPEAWLVTVRAARFAYGTTLSPQAAAAVPVAVDRVVRLLRPAVAGGMSGT